MRNLLLFCRKAGENVLFTWRYSASQDEHNFFSGTNRCRAEKLTKDEADLVVAEERKKDFDRGWNFVYWCEEA